MLSSLTIKNFALIEDIKLPLQDKFTVITGETGSGKSILLGALSLLLGNRVDKSTVRDPEKKCIVEGVFEVDAYNLQAFFNEEDLDYESQTFIRREILPSGKSRAFINDTPVNLQQLKALGQQLIDIHSQHETLSVTSAAYQLQVIDTLAKNQEEIQKYQEALAAYQETHIALETLKEEQAVAKKTYDYHSFLLEELKAASLKPSLLADLEERYKQLTNVEELKENLSGASYHLQQEEIGAMSSLLLAKQKLQSLVKFGNQYEQLHQRVASSLVDLEDVVVELDRLSEAIEDNPTELTSVSEQLEKIYALQQKHQVNSVEELIEIQTDLTQKVSLTENANEQLAALEEQLKTLKDKALAIAEKLHKNREKIAVKLAKQIESLLKQIGMPNAQLDISTTKTGNLLSNGITQVDWLLAANKGVGFGSIKKSASGGELSRITLAVKRILAFYSNMPTIIFDEIDTGVSGEVAQKMGDIMKEMSSKMQVISITHLPQIAAKGNWHLKVYKQTNVNKTQTHLKVLSTDERIEELAEMLGGKSKTASAIAHAKTLLE
ncbi:DNA repair protein RecN (Recombination protein N) [Mesonia hippocampi]|uniref:DNA repair protein RecN n=1 Tax=Mesonia hippocampi TaxID=1628250 RepID=A0A840EMU6_9FLAO|nr:DNA repair protein RecN [Mesonia hippocampi]MBB4119709.1 DNA repair protein RecN (Recombination protein N) [Mesonia hippocampi]